MAETEAIINSRPLTVESLSDINSEIPLFNLLTMKIDVIMPPPQEYSIDQTCNHIDNGDECSILLVNFGEFWSHCQKEFLQSLQARQKWNITKRNFQVGDVILLKEDTRRNKWPMAQIVITEPDS